MVSSSHLPSARCECAAGLSSSHARAQVDENVGNDSILSLIHEARVQFLRHYGYSELDLAGVALIMGDVAIEFKSELFYGDLLKASVTTGAFSRVGFELFYKLEKESGGKLLSVAFARTGMVCYNYSLKKVVSVPEALIAKWV